MRLGGDEFAVYATGMTKPEAANACLNRLYSEVEKIDVEEMRGTGHKGDVLVGISTSGNSKNILEAYNACKELGISIISMTGATGGKMKEASDLLLNVPSTDTPRIQESHIMIGHIICELVESAIFPKKV